jgi:hypothetical protein
VPTQAFISSRQNRSLGRTEVADLHDLLVGTHAQDFVRLDQLLEASCFERVRDDPRGWKLRLTW